MLSQVGVREATGRNDGLMVREYQKAAHVAPGGEWCAAFVCWVLDQAKVAPIIRNGWAAAWFPRARTIWKRGQPPISTPLPGDVIGYAYGRDRNHISHVGLVYRWGTGNSVTTIEGNTNAAGSRTGSGVWKKYRLKTQVHSIAVWIGQP